MCISVLSCMDLVYCYLAIFMFSLEFLYISHNLPVEVEAHNFVVALASSDCKDRLSFI